MYFRNRDDRAHRYTHGRDNLRAHRIQLQLLLVDHMTFLTVTKVGIRAVENAQTKILLCSWMLEYHGRDQTRAGGLSFDLLPEMLHSKAVSVSCA